MDLARSAELQTSTTRRLPPHSLEAEVSVLGGILLQPKSFSQVADCVRPEDFYHPVHSAIYQAMLELDAAGKPIDALTVPMQMKDNDSYGRLRAVNGEAYFAELISNVVTVENIAFHAKMVQGKAIVRALIVVAQETAAHGYGEYGDVAEYIDRAERSIFEIAQRFTSGRLERVHGLLSPALKQIEDRYERRGQVLGVPSTYHKIDALTDGWQPEQLIILAARPSMGKTGLMLGMVRRAAHDFGIPQLVFSLDSSKRQITTRLISQEARVDSTRIRSGYLDGRDFISLTKAFSRLHELPIWIDDTSAPTILELRSKARRWRADPNQGGSHALAAIWIDYVQLIVSPRAGKGPGNREQEVAEVSRALKALAKELQCPVIALAQLNRAVEGRADKRPQLSDLRESGQIEQDADVIGFIYRDEVYNKESPDRGIAELNFAKQKDGPTGMVRLAYLPQYHAFEALAENDYGDA